MSGMVERRLSEAQKRFFRRQFIRIGNPEHQVPCFEPIVSQATYNALHRKGMLEHSRFGWSLTAEGERVRRALDAALAEAGGGGEG